MGGRGICIHGLAKFLWPPLAQPTHDPLWEEYHDDDYEDPKGHPLPAEKVGPEELLGHVEDRCAEYRSPDGTFAAQDCHQHHPHAKCSTREGYLPVDEIVQVSEGAARKGQKERRNTPGHGLVTCGMNPHCLCLVLIVADCVDGKPESACVETPQCEEADHGENEKEEVIEETLLVWFSGIDRGDHAGAGTHKLPAACEFSGGNTDTKGADGEVVSSQTQDARS